MPDNNTPPDNTTPPETPAQAAKRNRSLVNQGHAADITLAGEIANTAELPAYATILAGEGIDAPFLTNLRSKITEAAALVANAGGKTSAKETTTKAEETRKAALLELIGVIQARAKRKYPMGDPLRANYFISEPIAANRAVLETSTRSIIAHLATDELPGMKTGDVPALEAALAAYLAVQTIQAGDQSGASGARASYEAKVKEVSRLRREIQYAVDAHWPAKKKANAAIRIEFKLSPDRALG
ncbi:hypothetical protein [Rariglobus hedericola]|uniref:Uncharacterized protein n=1 Tax=Rariglobus hedericola TaxID=2597822 RepID=A0A556QPE2_9BACT|nr:hypothetical protein [Rariglobus hedericola]TSJ78499.1 hypothetical protein FPL22_04145 [Rariglobus hedericola]